MTWGLHATHITIACLGLAIELEPFAVKIGRDGVISSAGRPVDVCRVILTRGVDIGRLVGDGRLVYKDGSVVVPPPHLVLGAREGVGAVLHVIALEHDDYFVGVVVIAFRVGRNNPGLGQSRSRNDGSGSDMSGTHGGITVLYRNIRE